jgi:tripartite-type tricarboxylate transporter receptor subunit TctC
MRREVPDWGASLIETLSEQNIDLLAARLPDSRRLIERLHREALTTATTPAHAGSFVLCENSNALQRSITEADVITVAQRRIGGFERQTRRYVDRLSAAQGWPAISGSRTTSSGRTRRNVEGGYLTMNGRASQAFGKVLTLGGAITLAFGLVACGPAEEADEDFPTEQIEMIVPWEAGGGTDQTARQLASAAEEACDTGIVVSNQTGSTGAVGFQAAADARPDGYTVGVATVEIAMINHLGVAPVTPEDVTAVMQYNFDPAAFSVGADSPYETIEDVLSAAEQENIRVGTSGTGSIWHVSFAGMAREADVEMTNVPFDGAAPAIAAVLGGQVEATSASGAEVRSQVEADELRPLAVMDEERLDILPDTPTLQEEGIDWTSGAWRGLVVPNDTPEDRVQALNECFREASESDGFQEFMENNGFGTVYRSAEEFDEYMNEEFERFGELIQELGLEQEQ